MAIGARRRRRAGQAPTVIFDAAQPDGAGEELEREDPELVVHRLLQEATAGTAEVPSGQYDFEFGRPYNTHLRHLTGAEYELRELTFEERFEVWRRAHQVWERNPWAKGGVRLIRSFTVGRGHTMTYRAQSVKEVLEAFRTDPENSLETYDKEFCEQLLLDGELFIRFTEPLRPTGTAAPETARLTIDPLPPWWVREIRTDPHFRKRVVAYLVQFSVGATPETATPLAAPEAVPPEQILHVAINKLGYEQRGRSELMAILPWLKAYKDWLEDRARQNRYRGAIYYHLAIENATAGQIATVRQQYRVPPPPASILVTGGNQKLTAVDAKVGASDAGEDGRQIRLASAAGLNLPEAMFSGDPSTSNQATAQAQREPADRGFEDYQDVLTNMVWRPIYRRVVQLALAAGIVHEQEPEIDADGEPVVDEKTGGPKVVAALEAFDLAYPPVAEHDPKSLAEALDIQIRNRLVSQQTAMQDLGRDPQAELKRLAAEEETEMLRVAQGLGIGDGQMPPSAMEQPGMVTGNGQLVMVGRNGGAENGDG